MQLKLTRSQKASGMISKSVVFMLDARADLSEEEKANVKKYTLGKTVIYNSERSKRFLEAGNAGSQSGTAGGLVKAFANVAMAKLSLNISIDGLTTGQHIECKDLDEMLGAMEAIEAACRTLKKYLDVAATFDGREEVVDY